MSLTREPCEPPATPTRPTIPIRQILFRHPGYDDSNNVLLKLFAPDVGQGPAGRGLYAQYALHACGIVAGNRWDGWLLEVKDLDASTQIDPTTILQKTSYYFHLPPLVSGDDTGNPNLPYPILPTFREWRFPHDRLPELWRQTALADCDFVNPEQSFATSNLTLALQARDVSCRITGCREGTQVAHICPQKEVEWWYENGMSRSNFGLANTLDDLSNALLLRTDLHIAFDKPKFVFIPKPSADPEKPKLVIHLIEASAELEYLYHNRALHPLRSSIETLFARFAWSIFPLLDAFLTCRQRRRLLLATANTSLFDSNGFVSWERCARFSRKRSQSPKKRKPEAGPAMDDNIGLSTIADNLHPRKRRQCRYTMSPHDPPCLSNCLLSDNVLDRALESSNNPLDHRGVDLDQRFASPMPASPTSVPALDVQASFGTTGSDNITHQSLSPVTASFSGAHDPSDIPVLAHTWLEQERLHSGTQGEWDEKKAWAKAVWTWNVTLDEERAKNWFEICGVEFQDAES